MNIFEHLENTLQDCYTVLLAQAKTRGEKHRMLVREVYRLAFQLRLNPIVEYHLEKVIENRNGSVDVVWFDGLYLVAAFEIDSSLRRKSILKLLATPAKHKIWVYYGNKDPFKFVGGIDLSNQIQVLSL